MQRPFAFDAPSAGAAPAFEAAATCTARSTHAVSSGFFGGYISARTPGLGERNGRVRLRFGRAAASSRLQGAKNWTCQRAHGDCVDQ